MAEKTKEEKTKKKPTKENENSILSSERVEEEGKGIINKTKCIIFLILFLSRPSIYFIETKLY